MKPPPFEYHRPGTLDEGLSLLAQHGSDAKVLAGGQSLVPAMNFRLARPAVLVDLSQIAELRGVGTNDKGSLRIGAMTTQRAVELSHDVAQQCPLLHETMPWIAHPQIRNRGTIGGSLAHADPAAELPAVMTALDATMLVSNVNGSRRVPASDFFTGLFSTALEPGDVLTAVLLEGDHGGNDTRYGTAFTEIARRHGDFALVGVAARVGVNSAGSCSVAAIVLFSVGDGPVRAATAAQALVGGRADPARLAEVANIAAEQDIDPPSDIHASAAYRRQLTRVLVRRALTTAFTRATSTSPRS